MSVYADDVDLPAAEKRGATYVKDDSVDDGLWGGDEADPHARGQDL